MIEVKVTQAESSDLDPNFVLFKYEKIIQGIA
jgi:hypothetical protein